jgi:hypothetical protein
MTIDPQQLFAGKMPCRWAPALIAASIPKMLFPFVAIGFLGAGAALAPSAADAASCTARYSPLGGNPNMPPIREQICTSEADHTDLKVSFLRLSEAVAGSLARKQPIGELETVLKGMTVAENVVFKALTTIFDKFGHPVTYPADSVRLVLNVKAASQGAAPGWKSVELPPAPRPANSAQRFWSVTSPFGNSSEGVSITMKQALASILKTDGWPAGFKQFYICRSSEILCTRNWTYLDLASLEQIERDTAAAEREAAGNLDQGTGSSDAIVSAADANTDPAEWPSPQYPANFSFYRYLGAQGWPLEFLPASSGNDECGGGYYFNYHPRPLVLDVAVIENASAVPVAVVDIVGSRSEQEGLRQSGAPDPSAPQAPLSQPGVTIAPQGRLVIPLRIAFADPVPEWRTPRRLGEARGMYQKLRSKPPQSIATVRIGNLRPQTIVRKRLASFAAPELPDIQDILFGPEIRLRGLIIKTPWSLDGSSFDLLTLIDNSLEHYEEPDIIQLTQPSPGGSCPILYSFVDGEWISHGKVIHTANGAGNVQTSVVPVDPSARRFRIAEEEPELATIKRVSLALTLKDGRRIVLNPAPLPNGKPAQDIRIRAYSRMTLEFVVPPEHATIEIAGSEVVVSGFYERYSNVAGR